LEERAWEENGITPSVGVPACGIEEVVLMNLYPDQVGGFDSIGVSVNFQHEEFSLHNDDAVNGGYGDAIATLSIGLHSGGVVTLFSAESGATYSFRIRPRSVWSMRGKMMEVVWAHKVDATRCPKGPHQGPQCKCRRSVNFRGLTTRRREGEEMEQ